MALENDRFGDLTVGVVSIREHVFMTVEVDIEVVLLEKRHIVSNDIGEVWVPFSPHRMVEDSSLP